MHSEVLIADANGHTTFSGIEHPIPFFEKGGAYNRWFESTHRVYFPPDGNYSIKKYTVWSSSRYPDRYSLESAVMAQLRQYRHEFGSGNRVIAVRDVAVYPAEEEINGIYVPIKDRYEVYMYVDRLDRFLDEDDTFQGKTKDAIHYCLQVCDVLSKFHAETGRTHNNINHHNIFLSGENVILGNGSLVSVKNDIIYYNAPEILRGQNPVPESDVYSLGIWLYYMLRRDDKNEFATGDRYNLPESQLKFRDDVSEKVANVIRKAVAADADNRYHTPEDMAKALQNATRPRTDWRKMAAAGAAVVVLAGAAVGIAIGLQPGEEEIRELIAASSYAEAYTEISALDAGADTDILIKTYIQSCRSAQEYNRIVEIVPLFSQEMFDSPEYLKMLFFWFREEKQMDILEPLLDQVIGKSEAIAAVIEELYQ